MVVDVDPTPMQLLRAICHILDLNIEEVRGGRRYSRLVKGKAVFFYFGRGFRFALADMARLVGVTHATTLHHLNAYDDILDKSKIYYSPQLNGELKLIKDKLRLRSIIC